MKPTIVILHGWGLSKQRFEPLIQEFTQRGYKVAAPDFPGFGETPAPENPWHLTDYARYLDNFLKSNKISTPIFIGHSFGGRVSLRYELLYPKSVRAIILTGTPGFRSSNSLKLVIFIAIAKIGKTLFSLPVLSSVFEKVRKRYYYLVGAREFTKAQGSMKETFKNIVQEPLTDDMNHVHVPCLLLWGEEDRMVPVSMAKRMNTSIPNSTLKIIEATDHGVPYKQPTLFADHVEKFISSLSL